MATRFDHRNLFAIDYCKTHRVTRQEFEEIWQNVDDATRNVGGHIRITILQSYLFILQHYNEESIKAKKNIKDAKSKALAAVRAVTGG